MLKIGDKVKVINGQYIGLEGIVMDIVIGVCEEVVYGVDLNMEAPVYMLASDLENL